MRLRRPLAAVAVTALALAGCTSSSASNAAAAGLTIYYEENAQVELIAPSGQRVLIDVWDPTLLSSPATSRDILLVSHTHSDHYYPAFGDSFPGQKLIDAAGTIDATGASITCIDAQHIHVPVVAGQAGNHICIVDLAGFRIVHFGDLGQDKLTDSQLGAIGKADIAFAPLFDVAGFGADLTEGGDYPITSMAQVGPSLLIPTHTNIDLVKLAAERWTTTYSTKLSVTISRDQLPAQTAVLLMGNLAPSYGSLLHLTESAW